MAGEPDSRLLCDLYYEIASAQQALFLVQDMREPHPAKCRVPRGLQVSRSEFGPVRAFVSQHE